MKTLGIIGFGNMGEALISGVKEAHPQLGLLVMENSGERMKLATQTYGAKNYNDNPALLFSESDAVILAVKPQDLPALGKIYGKFSGESRLISIAAGVSIERISELFGSPYVSRFMPSLAASVGKSVTGVSFSEDCDETFKEQAFSVAQSVGLAMEMPEHLIPSIIGISGSGIAFVYEFINAMALGGVKEGIKYEASLEVVLEVLEGAVGTIRSSGIGPGELITRVCSPGGTTIRGIESLHHNRFTATVMDAVSASAEKARDLER